LTYQVTLGDQYGSPPGRPKHQDKQREKLLVSLLER
jgi:hypothetical protein